jgi:hypothetical protein
MVNTYANSGQLLGFSCYLKPPFLVVLQSALEPFVIVFFLTCQRLASYQRMDVFFFYTICKRFCTSGAAVIFPLKKNHNISTCNITVITTLNKLPGVSGTLYVCTGLTLFATVTAGAGPGR